MLQLKSAKRGQVEAESRPLVCDIGFRFGAAPLKGIRLVGGDGWFR
ncbi:MAG TPA: hypothetical protein VHO66_04630 [Ruminiclostridium sp.]|nr:hypothetical protein [Ruminiclostridium sp.]